MTEVQSVVAALVAGREHGGTYEVRGARVPPRIWTVQMEGPSLGKGRVSERISGTK